MTDLKQQQDLAEINRICKLLVGHVWYKSLPGRYLVFRRGMGLIARRTTLHGLLKVLRNQVPADKLHLEPGDKREDPDEG